MRVCRCWWRHALKARAHRALGGCVMDEKWWWKFQPSTATVDKCHTAPPKRGNPAHAMYRILSHTLLSSAGSVSSLSLSRMRCGRRPWATEAWWHLPFFVIVDTCQPIRIAKAILSQKMRQSTWCWRRAMHRCIETHADLFDGLTSVTGVNAW